MKKTVQNLSNYKIIRATTTKKFESSLYKFKMCEILFIVLLHHQNKYLILMAAKGTNQYNRHRKYKSILNEKKKKKNHLHSNCGRKTK